MKVPPPEGVPESAEYDHTRGLWNDLHDNGVNRVFYADGDLAARGKKAKSKRIGIWKTYTPGGVVASQGEFKNDWRDGFWSFFDDRGDLYLKLRYTDGPKRSFGFLVTTNYGNENGPYTRYFPGGRLEESGEYYSGYYEGPVVRYFPDGNTALKGQYSRDKKDGLWKYYYPGGRLMKEEHYKKGILNGPVRVYHADGRLYHESLYIDGERADVKIKDRRFEIAG
jgi:antitoxin component YwqK of YwqJK toxin-antitoxin module